LDPYLKDVLDLLLRFLHVVAGIAWIGASFYFVRLDLKLQLPRDRRDEDEGVAGEYWGVHGGGFYHTQKYRVAPRQLPEPLHWFKWQAYTTWLTGFALLVVLYYVDADTRLVDPAVAGLSAWHAIGISAGSLAAGWLVYDLLCRFVRDDRALAVAVVALVVATAWALSELLAARAAFLQVGAILGTIMAGNVFFTIIPSQRELVRARQAGREPDPAPGIEAKRRSVHNNYLTLPVVFTMLAGHFPFTFGHEWEWLVLVAIMAVSAFFRHFFNLWHVGRRPWAIAAVTAVAAAGIAFWIAPDDDGAAPGAGAVSTERVQQIVAERCASCHAGVSAPNGVRLETAAQIESRADDIVEQAVRTRAMPPGNATGMTDAERDLVAAWAARR
jgi:uncharacterized membrane protein